MCIAREKSSSRGLHCKEWKVSNEDDRRNIEGFTIQSHRPIQEGDHLFAGQKGRELDDEVLRRIRQITDKRDIYGYLKVTAVLRKELSNEGKFPVNHKKVYRIMK